MVTRLSAAPVPLFGGKTFIGWEGDTAKTWRIENGEIIAGKPGAKQPRNAFLYTTRDSADFDLRLEYRRGENNGGIQFRSERVPNHWEVSGYQADFAPGIDGCLYDESRRNRFLAVFGVADVDLPNEAEARRARGIHAASACGAALKMPPAQRLAPGIFPKQHPDARD